MIQSLKQKEQSSIFRRKDFSKSCYIMVNSLMKQMRPTHSYQGLTFFLRVWYSPSHLYYLSISGVIIPVSAPRISSSK